MAEPLDEIPVGIAPVVTDPADNSLKELSGKGLLFVDSTGATKMADGGTVNPIVLGMLSQLSHGMGFPLLLIQNGAGRLLAIPATNDGTQRFLGSKNGQWQEAIPDNPSCWDYDEICACPADQIAGWQLSDSGQWCLVRLDPADLVGATHFTNTNTTLITGSGTTGSPYGVNVKISAQSGNRLQILSDGLYVGPEY